MWVAANTNLKGQRPFFTIDSKELPDHGKWYKVMICDGERKHSVSLLWSWLSLHDWSTHINVSRYRIHWVLSKSRISSVWECLSWMLVSRGSLLHNIILPCVFTLPHMCRKTGLWVWARIWTDRLTMFRRPVSKNLSQRLSATKK